MPRINIEDDLWKDDRFMALVERIGKFRALGVVAYAWKVAQNFWKQGKLIPPEIWKLHDFPEALFEVNFAERRPEGVYVRGSKKQFAWLLAKSENGKLGGRPAKTRAELAPSSAEGQGTEFSNEIKEVVKATESYAKATETLSSLSSLLLKKKKRGKPDLSVLPLLALLWNENRGSRLAAVTACGSARRRAIISAWNEHADELFWVSVIRQIASNTFLNGECPSKSNPSWKASFDWMLKPDNVHKVLEGNYDQTGRSAAQKALSFTPEDFSKPYNETFDRRDT